MWGKTAKWIEVRIGLDELVTQYFRKYMMPKGAGFLSTMGFVALVAFFVQVVTGLLLLLYYVPHPDYAFASVETITNEISYGWLFRKIHNIGSNIIVATIIIHIVHVFFRGSYKRPRELTWLTGGLMFFLVLFFCTTGQLLPWNQSGYWATTVVSSTPAFLPIIGEHIGAFLKGGEYVSTLTLSRFFSFHAVILPAAAILVIVLHAFLVRRQGLSTSPKEEAAVGANAATEVFHQDIHPGGLPCYPDFFLKRLFMVLIYCSIIFFIMAFLPDIFLPEGANTMANPLLTPESIGPPWYFLAPYQLIKMIPNDLFGLALQVLLIMVFLFWPFLDALEEKRNILKRPVLLTAVLITMFLWLLLTFWGMK